MGMVFGITKASEPPPKRDISRETTCEVWNAIFSTTQIAIRGKVAHRTAARRAQAETNRR
jgi:hypothetical protein